MSELPLSMEDLEEFELFSEADAATESREGPPNDVDTGAENLLERFKRQLALFRSA